MKTLYILAFIRRQEIASYFIYLFNLICLTVITVICNTKVCCFKGMAPILIFILLLLLLLLSFTYYHIRQLNYWPRKNVPSIKPLPLIGNIWDVFLLRKQIGELLREFYEHQKSPFFGIHIFTTPYLVIKSPELIKSVLTKDFHHFQNRLVGAFKDCDPYWCNFLFSIKNPEWKELRAKMSPIFTKLKLRSMAILMNEVGDDLVNHLIQHTQSGSNLIQAKEMFSKYTTNVIASCAFGVNSNCFQIENGPVEEAGKDIFGTKLHIALKQTCYFFFPSIVKLFKLRFIDKSVIDVLGEMFWKTIKERQESNLKRNDLIDMIIELKQKEQISQVLKFDDFKALSMAMNFFAGGLETTSTTMAFALYELALNRGIQNKLKDEIRLHTKQNSNLTLEAIQSMKYLDMIISETLRKHPILTFLDRECTERYKLPGTDLIIEKDHRILVPLYGLQYDPEFFPNPELFDPERFTEENVATRYQYSYIPFGEGPRFCIGERFGLLSAKIGVIKIVSEFNVERCEKTPDKVELNPSTFLINPKNDIMLRFTRCSIFTDNN